MALIDLPELSDFDEEVRRFIEARMKYMDIEEPQNLHLALAQKPQFMKTLNHETSLLWSDSELSRPTKEILALATSMVNGCRH